MTETEIYQATVALKGLKIGDEVVITHKVPDHFLGWANGWVNSMDYLIGKNAIIEKDSGLTGYCLNLSFSNFPVYALTKVETIYNNMKGLQNG